MSLAEWRKHKPVIEALFEPGWCLGWLDAALTDARNDRKRRSKAGKKGNDVRWNKKRHFHADRHAFGSGSQCDPNAITSGSLPPASPHSKDSQQGMASPSSEEIVVNGPAVIPFLRGNE